MILKSYIPITILLVFLEFSGISCRRLSGVRSFLFSAALKRVLPFDPSVGLEVLESLPYLKRKYGKIMNQSSDGTIWTILSETKDLMKEYMSTTEFDENQVFFYLFKPEDTSLIPLNLKDVSGTKGKLFLITHGWIEDTDDEDWHKTLAKALIDKFPGSKVILVDWGSSSNKFLYALSAARTKHVGDLIARRLVNLVEEYKFPLKHIILIGYDLGAHICGHAGNSFLEATNETLSEIIGLDPTGFLFEGREGKYRLDQSDADVVMVVHTSSHLVGFESQCGTIDFYPNGGISQPGCPTWNFLCSHQRSYQLFTSAISAPKAFPTNKCSSSEEFDQGKCVNGKVYFGNISETKKGKYYFTTTDKPPYHKASFRKGSFLGRWW